MKVIIDVNYFILNEIVSVYVSAFYWFIFVVYLVSVVCIIFYFMTLQRFCLFILHFKILEKYFKYINNT